jgi:Tfp pilus assembly protein PilF
LVLGGADRLRPRGGTTSPSTTTAGTTTTGLAPIPTKVDPPKDPTPKGLTDGPEDPYGTGGETPPTDSTDAAMPEKKAEFFANLGAQQLASGDATSAASSFKKALEIDSKSVVATIGLGEIALRQGLFGDAIAHLRKASRMAPRSSRVFTLLGESFLNSGNTSEAMSNFKRALQLDPDNVRAREGFDEAQARTTSPPDE